MKLRLLLPAFVLVFVGCVPIPHSERRSPEVRGKVVDATTHKPISHAKIVFIENSALAAMTDEQGDFTIKETRKFEPFMVIAEGGPDVSLQKTYLPKLRISRDGYAPAEIYAFEDQNVDFSRYDPKPHNAYWIEGPIFLRPIALEPIVR